MYHKMADNATKIAVIKSILSVHARTGADIHIIRKEYREQEGCELEGSTADAFTFLCRIPDIISKDGRFYTRSKESEHIAKLVKEQRQNSPPKRRRRNSCYFDRDQIRVSDDDAHTISSFNWMPRGRSATRSRWLDDQKRSKSSIRPQIAEFVRSVVVQPRESPPPRNNSRWENDVQPQLSLSTRDPRINNNIDRPADRDKIDNAMQLMQTNATNAPQYKQFRVIADDFFFNYILEFTSFRVQPENDEETLLEPKWSYCVVGQTIAEAIELVRSKNVDDIPVNPVNVIINIGAADIGRGKTFVQMVKNFMELIDTCIKLNMEPTITTILPVGTHAMSEQHAWKVHLFNQFLMDNFSDVVDLWACFAIGFSRTLGTLLKLNDVSTRLSGRETDITWERDNQEMSLEHRPK